MHQMNQVYRQGTPSVAAPPPVKHRARGAARIALLGVLVAVSGCEDPAGGDESHKINGSVHVAAGRQPGSAETVNGSIHIDDNATVTTASSVNGSIHLGARATADALKAVNGEITVGAGAHVARAVQSVNGSLILRDGAEVLGAVQNVAGRIELTGAHVAGGIETVNGDISILGASHVEGGILVKKPSNGLIHIGTDIPRIVVGPGATVNGDLRFEREVHLYVSDRATIGAVTGASAVTFTGDAPPK